MRRECEHRRQERYDKRLHFGAVEHFFARWTAISALRTTALRSSCPRNPYFFGMLWRCGIRTAGVQDGNRNRVVTAGIGSNSFLTCKIPATQSAGALSLMNVVRPTQME